MTRPVRTSHLIRLLSLAGLACLSAAGCSSQMYEGAPRAAPQVAIINVGSTVVREINGQPRRGGAFDVGHFEVAPGRHRITLVFERPARSLGLKTLPAETGDGVCVLTFEVIGNRQYYLGARAHGDDTNPRWDRRWQGWVRDPASVGEDDIIARCESTQVAAAADAPAPTRTVLAPMAPPATPLAAPGDAARPTAAPAIVAPVPVPAAVSVGAAPTPLPLRPAAPLPPPVRVGAVTRLDGALAASAIDAAYDALTFNDSDRAERVRLAAALGSGWAVLEINGTDQIVLYRRARLRPCTRPAAVVGCLESADATSDSASPLELRLEPAR